MLPFPLHGLPDESSDYADAVLTLVERDGSRVPDLWAHEIATGIAVAYLRKRITSADEQAFRASHLRIDVEEAASALTVIRDGTAAAMRHGLTLTMQRVSILPCGKH